MENKNLTFWVDLWSLHNGMYDFCELGVKIWLKRGSTYLKLCVLAFGHEELWEQETGTDWPTGRGHKVKEGNLHTVDYWQFQSPDIKYDHYQQSISPVLAFDYKILFLFKHTQVSLLGKQLMRGSFPKQLYVDWVTIEL